MLTVRDLMTPDPLTLEPEETLRCAADVLTSAGVSGAPVTSGGRVIGVVSLTDILAFEADDPGVPTYRPEPLDPLEDEAAEEPEIAGEPAGSWFVDLWEDAGAEVTSRMAETDGPEWDTLDEHTVAEVMTRVVFSVTPATAVSDAARLMAKEGIHRLLVLEDGAAVGIVTASDVVAAVARDELIPSQSATAAAVD